MSKQIRLSDEQYQTIQIAAERRGQSPEAVLAAWLEELRDRDLQPHYYETDDWLRHLGASDEEIATLNHEVAEEENRRAAEQRANANSR